MSGIAGLLRSDGRPEERGSLERMTAALARRGPDAGGHWVDGGTALGHRLLHTTAESLQEKQPVADERGECRLVWDGRLDNRDELIAALDPRARRDRTDPEIVLDAYVRWGEGFLSRILGDFALAIWDGRARRLLCARDPLGVKPFYYVWSAGRLAFASRAPALVDVLSAGARPNEAMVGDFLLMDFRRPAATFFDGLNQLPPGHLLTVDGGALSVRRYWDVDPGRETRFGRDEEYLERFRELFREAVRCRLRSQAPVAVLLSGGIDSSAVAAMAETIRREALDPAGLVGFTLLCEGFLAEEWQAIEALRRVYGTETHALRPESDGRPLTRFETFLGQPEVIHHDSFMTLPALLEPMAERGCRVLLTGFGADELVAAAETGYLQDLARSFRWVRFSREVRRMADAYALDGFGSASSLVWTQLPGGLKRVVKKGAGRDAPPWLEPGFSRRARIAERIGVPPSRRFLTLCREASYRALTEPGLGQALACMDASAAGWSIECRHPFLDRRLIEFFLSIPDEVKVGRGYRKMFLQESLRPVSASPPRPRESGAVAVESMAAAAWQRADAERLREVLFRRDSLVFEYVDRREAERIRDRYLAGDERCRNLLWQFARLELWLREFVGGRP